MDFKCVDQLLSSLGRDPDYPLGLFIHLYQAHVKFLYGPGLEVN